MLFFWGLCANSLRLCNLLVEHDAKKDRERFFLSLNCAVKKFQYLIVWRGRQTEKEKRKKENQTRLVIKSVALNCGMKLKEYRNDQSFLIAALAHAHTHTLLKCESISLIDWTAFI